MDLIETTLDQMSLDLENPRFSGFKSTRDALAQIVSDQGTKLLELAKDIVDQGLNPANRLLVIRGSSDDSFVVVDGNRRFCALKILMNPSAVDGIDGISAGLKTGFKKQAEKFDRTTVEPIQVALLDSREEANQWIDLIHTGENKGRGLVGWDGTATDRFRGGSPSYQVLKLLNAANYLTSEQAEAFPITNLARLLGTKEVRERLGIAIEGGQPKLLYELKELAPLLKHVAQQIATSEITVSDIKSVGDRVAYAQNLPKKLFPKTTAQLSSPVFVSEVLDNLSIGSKPAAKKSNPSSYAKPPRRQLIPRSCKLSVGVRKIENIVFELRELNLEKTPTAVAVLFRVFIELTMDAYAKKCKISGFNPDKDNLENKVLKIADYLQQHGMSKNELHSFRRVAGNAQSPLYVERLHKFVHSQSSMPTASELRTGWDEVQEVFEKIWS
jgi:hypothetical protein